MALDRLSQAIEGGIPQGTSVVLNGSPGTGKTTLALQLVHDHLQSDGECMIIATEAAPAQMMRQASLAGLTLEPMLGGSLRFLDAYSWRAGKTGEGPGITGVRSLADLSELSIKLTEMLGTAPRDRPLLVLFDSPSTLTLHAPATSILKLLEIVFAKVKTASGSVLAAVEKDMHDDVSLAALAAMADGVMNFRLVEEDDDLVRQVRVLSMRTAPGVSSRWMRMGLTKQGLSLMAAPPKGTA